jgi:hypothetical protein
MIGIASGGVHAAVLDLTPGTLINSDNEHPYKVFYAPQLSWTDASAYIHNNLPGWYLATATSQDENVWIWGAVNGAWSRNGGNFPPGQYWLGGYMPSPNPPHHWAWVTGEPWSYTDWANGEPNGDGGWTGPLTIGRFNSHAWNDEGSQLGLISGFVAESGSVVPEPNTITLFAVGLAFVLANGLRRRRRLSSIML